MSSGKTIISVMKWQYKSKIFFSKEVFGGEEHFALAQITLGINFKIFGLLKYRKYSPSTKVCIYKFTLVRGLWKTAIEDYDFRLALLLPSFLDIESSVEIRLNSIVGERIFLVKVEPIRDSLSQRGTCKNTLLWALLPAIKNTISLICKQGDRMTNEVFDLQTSIQASQS